MLDSVSTALESLQGTEVEMIVICCGTNDIDKNSGDAVAHKIISLAHKIRLERPLTKIIISETTPRKLHRDEEIKQCNDVLHAQLDGTPNVEIAVQSGLRTQNWELYEDDKHILRNKINIYAGNIKSAMRKARTGNHSSNNATSTMMPPTHMSAAIVSTATNTHGIKYRDFRYTPAANSNFNSNTNNTKSYAAATPLMSHAVAPPPHLVNNNHPPRKPDPPPQPQTLPPVASKSYQSTHRTTSIGERLLSISQEEPSGENKMRDTLITKLSEVIKCLQVW